MPDPISANVPTQTEPPVINDENAAVEVVLAGEKKKVPIKELRDRYQKEHVAEKRFQEAAQLKAQVEEDLAVAADLKAGLLKQDEAALRRAFRKAGLSQEQVDATFSAHSANATSADSGNAGDIITGGDVVTDVDGDEDFDVLLGTIEKLQEKIQKLEEREMNRERTAQQQTALQQVDSALDKDEELAVLLGGLEPDDARELRQLAYKYVSQASQTEPWGPRAIQKGLELLKARRKAWSGSTTSEAGASTARAGGLPPAGFGPTSSTTGKLHQSKDIDRPHSVFEKDYGETLLQRLRAKLGR